jgi:hypothetical protein
MWWVSILCYVVDNMNVVFSLWQGKDLFLSLHVFQAISGGHSLLLSLFLRLFFQNKAAGA